MTDSCPTCGREVRVVTGDEGTSHYEPVQPEGLNEALEDLTAIIEAADRIDSLDHRLNDGRVIDSEIVVGGTQIQDECQAIRTHVRAASARFARLRGEDE